jgi:hypothetical protein
MILKLRLFWPFYIRRFRRWFLRLRGIDTYEMVMEELNDSYEIAKIKIGFALLPTLRKYLRDISNNMIQ